MTQRTINEGDKKEWRVLRGRLPRICRCLLQQYAMCDHSLCDTMLLMASELLLWLQTN